MRFLPKIILALVLVVFFLNAGNIQAQIPDPYVPCNDEEYPEFHSLRPYQASPCDEKKVTDTARFCGNDLIVKRTFDVTPSQASSCQTLSNGNLNCTYNFTGQSTNVRISLDESELPIVGNTELVVNSQNEEASISDLTKVNEYVSWYLNGVNFRAEEQYPRYLDTQKTVDLAGPLNKLLPWRVQVNKRVETIIEAGDSKGETKIRHNQIVGCTTAVFGGVMIPCYNQNLQEVASAYLSIIRDIEVPEQRLLAIIELLRIFPVDSVLDIGFQALDQVGIEIPLPIQIVLRGGNAAKNVMLDFMARAAISLGLADALSDAVLGILPAFLPDLPADVLVDTHRLTEWLDDLPKRLPPKEEDYTDFREYWKAYKAWRGEVCTPTILGFYYCGNDIFVGGFLRSDFWANLFPYIPYSTTEDATGQVETVADFIPADQPSQDAQVTNVDFLPNSEAEVKEALYFAHVREVDELADLLQSTFLARGESPFIPNRAEENPDEIRHCEIVETRSNPGDDLFGEVPGGTGGFDTQIDGNLAYDVSFTCEFGPQPSEENEDEEENIQTCSKDVYVAMEIYTQTPKADQLWQKLVDGEFGVFKRFYPKVSEGSPLTEIKDIPAVTNAQYTGGTAILAGNPQVNRSGENAEIFFPFIGGLHEYFLKGIQTALRPKGFGSSVISGQTPTSGISSLPNQGDPVDPGQCREVWSGVPLSGFPGPVAQAMQAASEKFNIPLCVLTGIASVEGSRMRNLTDAQAVELTRPWQGSPEEEVDTELLDFIHCQPNSASAQGPMQMTPGAFNPYQNASQGYLGSRNPSVCNAADAIFAAAQFLVEGRLSYYGYPPGSPWNEPRKYCAAGQTYYGSCRLDAPTCGNLGTNYCDFLLNHCQVSGSCSDYFQTESR